MRKFTTELRAIDPSDGEIKTWQGPDIDAISFADAQQYCINNGLGYLTVTGILVAVIGDDGIITNYDTSEN